MKSLQKLGAVAVIACLSLTPAAAQETGGGENPPEYDYLCSPGYFKNHTEVWADLVSEEDYATLISMLTATGQKNGWLKQEAAAFLNSLFFGGELPCEDGDPISE